MGDLDKVAAKQAKKLAKAAQKAQKRRSSLSPPPGGPLAAAPPQESDATRLAERKLALERWRTIFGAVGALIALLSLLVTYLALRGRG